MLSTVISATIATLLVARLAFRIVWISGSSMTPDFLPGDRVLTFLFWPARWLRVGQVVLIPTNPKNHRVHRNSAVVVRSGLAPAESGGSKARSKRPRASWRIKRVAGTPGTSVRVPPVQDLGTVSTVLVPKNHLYVLGTTSDSYDSRSHGPIRTSAFVPVVLAKMSSRPVANQE